MTDQNLTDFYTRIARIERMHAKGYGFEAVGTLGKSLRRNRRSRLVPVLRSALFMVIGAILLKTAMMATVGPDLYGERVARLADGEGFDKLGAVLMAADPVSSLLADWMRAHMPQQG